MSAGCGTVCSWDSCYCFHYSKRKKKKQHYALAFGLKPIKVAHTKEAKKCHTWFGKVPQTLTFWLLVGMGHHNAWHHSNAVSLFLSPAASTLVKASGFFFGVCNCLNCVPGTCYWALIHIVKTAEGRLQGAGWRGMSLVSVWQAGTRRCLSP